MATRRTRVAPSRGCAPCPRTPAHRGPQAVPDAWHFCSMRNSRSSRDALTRQRCSPLRIPCFAKVLAESSSSPPATSWRLISGRAPVIRSERTVRREGFARQAPPCFTRPICGCRAISARRQVTATKRSTPIAGISRSDPRPSHRSRRICDRCARVSRDSSSPTRDADRKDRAEFAIPFVRVNPTCARCSAPAARSPTSSPTRASPARAPARAVPRQTTRPPSTDRPSGSATSRR
jgi:hypothetical protein